MIFKKSTLFLIFFSPAITFAQVSFEKAYFIDNEGQKTECFIKNLDWKNSPNRFEYKLSNESESKILTIGSVKEFGIDNVSKYVRAMVKMDRSSDTYDSLTNDRRPIWSEQQVFLQVLVSGKPSLYLYQNVNLTRFFFGVEGLAVQQLVRKKYLTPDGNVVVNSDFRQQLWTEVNCGLESQNSVEHIAYTARDLVRFFNKHNECNGEKIIDYITQKKVDLFRVRIRPGLEIISLDIMEPTIYGGTADIMFTTQASFRFGAEAEYVLPYNKNKWAIVAEPTWQSYSGRNDGGSPHGGAKLSYSCLEMPIGARHYFFLEKDAKIFLNAFIVPDFPLKSQATFADGFYLDFHSTFCFSLGAGLSNKRFSGEIRYYTQRNMILIQGWGCDYHKFSFILGYRIF